MWATSETEHILGRNLLDDDENLLFFFLFHVMSNTQKLGLLGGLDDEEVVENSVSYPEILCEYDDDDDDDIEEEEEDV